MKIQNNKTKTATTIVITSAIVLAILSPSTILPTINAMQAGTSAFEKLNLKEMPLLKLHNVQIFSHIKLKSEECQ